MERSPPPAALARHKLGSAATRRLHLRLGRRPPPGARDAFPAPRSTAEKSALKGQRAGRPACVWACVRPAPGSRVSGPPPSQAKRSPSAGGTEWWVWGRGPERGCRGGAEAVLPPRVSPRYLGPQVSFSGCRGQSWPGELGAEARGVGGARRPWVPWRPGTRKPPAWRWTGAGSTCMCARYRARAFFVCVFYCVCLLVFSFNGGQLGGIGENSRRRIRGHTHPYSCHQSEVRIGVIARSAPIEWET